MKIHNVSSGLVAVLVALAVECSVSAAGSASPAGAGHAKQNSLKLACGALGAVELEDAHGERVGKGLNVVTAALERHRLNVNFTELPRQRGILEAENGRYDGLCSCLPNESLGASFFYSKPLGTTSVGALAKRSGGSLPDLVDRGGLSAKGLRWGVVSDDGLNGYLKQAGVGDYVLVESYAQGYRMLDLGRLDALLVHKSAVQDFKRPLKYSYEELLRPSFHLCLTGPRGKKVIEALNVTLKIEGVNASGSQTHSP